MSNKKTHEAITELFRKREENKHKHKGKIFAFTCFIPEGVDGKDGEADTQILVNGLTHPEAEEVAKHIYGGVYAKNPLNQKKLEDKKKCSKNTATKSSS